MQSWSSIHKVMWWILNPTLQPYDMQISKAHRNCCSLHYSSRKYCQFLTWITTFASYLVFWKANETIPIQWYDMSSAHESSYNFKLTIKCCINIFNETIESSRFGLSLAFKLAKTQATSTAQLYILIIDYAEAERSSTAECKLRLTLPNTVRNLPISMGKSQQWNMDRVLEAQWNL